jgi:hypothetical protein
MIKLNNPDEELNLLLDSVDPEVIQTKKEEITEPVSIYDDLF